MTHSNLGFLLAQFFKSFILSSKKELNELANFDGIASRYALMNIEEGASFSDVPSSTIVDFILPGKFHSPKFFLCNSIFSYFSKQILHQ